MKTLTLLILLSLANCAHHSITRTTISDPQNDFSELLQQKPKEEEPSFFRRAIGAWGERQRNKVNLTCRPNGLGALNCTNY